MVGFCARERIALAALGVLAKDCGEQPVAILGLRNVCGNAGLLFLFDKIKMLQS